MAATVIKLYSFSKRENSTKRPSGAGTSFNATFIEDTNIINPALKMNFAANVNPVNYNYAYIADFNRYYFVSNWEMDHGFWIIHLNCDVLASAQTQIKASTEYVLRASQLTDGTIIDDYYPIKGSTLVADRNVAPSDPFAGSSWDINSNYIIICTAGGPTAASSTNPGINYYAMSFSTFCALMSWINQDITDYLDPTDFGAETLKSLYNPFQYILSAKLFPVNVGTGSIEGINFGYWTTPVNISGHPVSARFIDIQSKYIVLGDHPQASTRGTYLNLSPYTEMVLHAPPFGDIPLDTTKIIGKARLFFKILIDLYSGDATLFIKASNAAASAGSNFDAIQDGIIAVAYANVAWDIPLTQIRQDYLGIQQTNMNNAGAAASQMVSGNIVGGIMSAISGIGDVARASMPSVQIKPSDGNLLSRADFWRLTVTHKTVVDRDLAQQGAPLCQAVALSSVWGGYALIESADFASDVMTQEENQKIKNYLESGVFLEG